MLEYKSNLEIIFEGVILTISIIFIFLGFSGLIAITTTHGYRSDKVLEYAYAFIYSYMLILGIILMIYRKKLVVRPEIR
ncbi:MAG: hypothetical protein GTN36_01900 [Candidatus Aenigmarchaeota archaeon]|nr:hypothetical protein [Candidatus Aenigmarchaeota archaeon]